MRFNNMKNLLNYFYHIYPDKIFKKDETLYFFLDEYKYFLIEFNRNIEELNILVELANALYEKNIKVHTFIKNINDNFFVSFAGANYVLLRINTVEDEELDLIDIINFNKSMIVDKNILYSNDWIHRWSEQVDRFENQISEYNKEYPILLSCFDYYIGLAENAISYLKVIEENNKEKSMLYLSHKRIEYPLNYEFLYNPLNFMFDSKVRDVAEYIKVKFFYDAFDIEEFESYILNNKFLLGIEEIKLLYARLIYPTYYFDFFEKVINDREDENKFKKYIDLSNKYEYFLMDVYKFLKNKYNIEPIDWIANKN